MKWCIALVIMAAGCSQQGYIRAASIRDTYEKVRERVYLRSSALIQDAIDAEEHADFCGVIGYHKLE